MDVLEYIEDRKGKLTLALAQAAMDENQKVVDQIRGALLEFEMMRQAFTPQIEVTIEESDGPL